MIIKPIPALSDNYIWAICNQSMTKAIIVDPGDGQVVIDFLQKTGLELVAILITHHHWDHTQGVKTLLKQYDTQAFASMPEQFDFAATQAMSDKTIKIDEFPPIKVMSIPGHTLDHTAYHLDNCLFTGDMLFSIGCGRIFEGTAEIMFKSLKKITTFTDSTQIYCGHEYTLKNIEFAQLVDPEPNRYQNYKQKCIDLAQKGQSTLPSSIAIEKALNPFLRTHETGIINKVSEHVGRPLDGPLEVFKELRLWKDRW